jgi:hypothetical protein
MKKWLLVLTFVSGVAFGQECEDGKVRMENANVQFEGGKTVPKPVLNDMIRELKQEVKDKPCQDPEELSERMRDAFQKRGYFKVLVHPALLNQIGGDSTGKKRNVLFVVEEGNQFRLETIDFSGSTVFDGEKLRAAVPLKDGELFDVEKMRAGIKNLRDLYGSRGYINFTPVPDTRIDDQRHTIAVTFDLDEGAQFRFGDLIFKGIARYSGAEQKLRELWKPLRGTVFDPSLPARVLEIVAGKRKGSGVEKALADEITHGAWFTNVQDNQNKTMNIQVEFAARVP